MKLASNILFWLTLLSTIYLFASPQLQPKAGDVIQAESQHEQGGEYRRGWPLTYLTYVAEHGDSKSTYYDFSYNYKPFRPFSLAVNIVIFTIILMALVRYPKVSHNQLWIATASFFVLVSIIAMVITGSYNEQNLTSFHARLIGTDRTLHFLIFSVLFASLFFVALRMVVVICAIRQNKQPSESTQVAN